VQNGLRACELFNLQPNKYDFTELIPQSTINTDTLSLDSNSLSIGKLEEYL
jgi:hypothetical protein